MSLNYDLKWQVINKKFKDINTPIVLPDTYIFNHKHRDIWGRMNISLKLAVTELLKPEIVPDVSLHEWYGCVHCGWTTLRHRFLSSLKKGHSTIIRHKTIMWALCLHGTHCLIKKKLFVSLDTAARIWHKHRPSVQDLRMWWDSEQAFNMELLHSEPYKHKGTDMSEININRRASGTLKHVQFSQIKRSFRAKEIQQRLKSTCKPDLH